MKEVDADESTVRFYQEVYDAAGTLREVHHKYPVDLGHPQIDSLDVASVVDVELYQRQEQRDHRTEEKDTDEKAPPDAAAEAGEREPRRREARRWRSAIGLTIVVAGVCLRHPAKLDLATTSSRNSCNSSKYDYPAPSASIRTSTYTMA